VIKAVLFDFSDVVGRVRMAVAGDPGEGPYHIELVTPVVDAIERLRKAGVRVALVTNNDRGAFAHHAPHLDLDALFDVVVFSSDVGVSKPSFKIFVHTLQQVGVDAHEAMFVDDLSRNVDAAEALGMTGVVADSEQSVVDAVNGLLEAH
jgi:epoxide hydrolase-like predicted phosphatase